MRKARLLNWLMIAALLLGALPVGGTAHAAPLSGTANPVRSTAQPADVVTPILDGVRDAGYVKIATDPSGDLGPCCWTGINWMDLTNLYVAADATTLYVYADAGFDFAQSAGQIGLAIDTDGKPNSGGAADPWGNAITFDYTHIDGAQGVAKFLPDYVIRGNVNNSLSGGDHGDGWTELRKWQNGNWNTGTGTNWGGLTGSNLIGTHLAYSNTQGVEFAILLADIGNPDPANVHLQFFVTQGGGSKGAFDTLPGDDQSTGWDDATIQHQLVSVPLAIDPAGDLAGTIGSAPNLAWTDMTRLHIWADQSSLHLFVPMAAYSTTLSAGQLLMAIDTKAGGGSGDPWGNAITLAYTTTWQNLGHTPIVTTSTILPDYLIRGNIFGPADNGWTEFRKWNGSDWNTGGGSDWGGIGNSGQPSQPGSKIAWRSGDGLRITIPFADIGVVAGNTINLEFAGTQGGGGKGVYDTVPSDNQSTDLNTPTTQRVYATYTIPDIPSPAASHDNNVWGDGLGHNSQDALYRVPFGAVNPGTPITLRLRSYANDLTGARVRFYDTATSSEFFQEMTLAATNAPCYDAALVLTCDYWATTITPTQLSTLYYRFIAMDGTATAYYADDAWKDGGWGAASASMADNSYVVTVFDPAFQPIPWMQNAVVYQIFPDRFRNGNPGNDPTGLEPRYNYPGGANPADDQILRKNWAALPEGHCRAYVNPAIPCTETARGRDYYGGDLQGVTLKLDYLQALGVTVIYFNPIFDAGSDHLYDTQDYLKIDPFFGTQQDWDKLVTAANAHGIKIVLDGVFNHLSSDSKYFDRYHHYPEIGACEAITSTYRSWFSFTDATPGTGTCAGTGGALSANYEGWFGFDSIPVLNKNNPAVRTLVYSGTNSIAPYWLNEGAAGWRLDVMGDGSFPADYWQQFRQSVKSTKSDAIIIGELWKKDEMLPKIQGDMADTGMNYRFRNAILGFFGTVDNKGFFDDGQTNQPPSLFVKKLMSVREDYPDATFYTLMNLMDSHDTKRILWSLTPGQSNREQKEFNAANLAQGKQLLKLATLVQMTMPGAPTIYYGDEVALNGDDDPDDRRPFPWQYVFYLPIMRKISTGLQTAQPLNGVPVYYNAAGDHTILDWYRQLTALRHNRSVFSTGEQHFLLADDANRTLAYLMRTDTDAALVAVNRDAITRTLIVTATGYLPDSVRLTDALGLSADVTATTGLVTFDLAPLSGVVFVPKSGQNLVAPAAPTNLTAVAGNGSVALAWSSVVSATKYNVYRSYVTGGGYNWITSTVTITLTDTTVSNGTRYFYVVTALDAAGNESVDSNEAAATPSFPIGYAVLQSPKTLQHTLGITPTANIYGQVYAAGLTDATGNESQIKAQLGFGVLTPTLWSTWTPMSFNTRSGNNYEYKATLRPEITGTFDLLVRFSDDNGLSWIYGDQNGIGFTTPGVLTVTANSDVTPPAAPANLRVTDWSSGFIALAWDAVPDAAEYWLYRRTGAIYGVPLAKLSNTLVYTDLAVANGVTYTYGLKAVDPALNFSPLSNEVVKQAAPKMVNVTFRVRVPAETPADDVVFLPGDQPAMGPWNPGKLVMTKISPNTWEATVPILDGTVVQYKYARGVWERVEWWGSIVSTANRNVSISYSGTGNQLVDNTATDWGTGADVTKAVQFWRDPLVTTTLPISGAVNVAASLPVTVTFARDIQTLQGGSFANSIVVKQGATTISGTVTAPNTTQLVWTPAAPLAYGVYTVTVFNVRSNLGGDSVSMQKPYVFTFTVGP